MQAPSRAWLRVIVAEFAKFGVVGAVCTVIDVGLFNALHFGAGVDPLVSKSLSVAVAATVSYLGNRHWSFRSRGGGGFGREFPVFFVLNAIGLGFSLACLAITKYGFGLTGPLALNLAGNVVGMGLATVFRFWSYRRWVFPPVAADDPRAFLGRRLVASDESRLDEAGTRGPGVCLVFAKRRQVGSVGLTPESGDGD